MSSATNRNDSPDPDATPLEASGAESRYVVRRVLSDSTVVCCALAEDSVTGREVILREVPAKFFKGNGFAAVHQDIELLKTVSSPFYSKPVDQEINDSTVRVVYQYFDGHSLATTARNEQIAVEKIIQWAIELASALDEVHQVGSVQRDLRPSNIIVRENGSVVLGGYAPLWRPEMFHRQDRLGVDCATFASPELAGLIDQDVGACSDLYSLGLVLDSVLAGTPAFTGGLKDVLYQQLTTEPDFNRYPEHTPRAFKAIVRRLVQKEPRNRYQSASGLLHDLRRLSDLVKNDQPDEGIKLGEGDHRGELSDPEFVGRNGIVEDFARVLAECNDGNRVPPVLIQSVSGMGKTRLELECIKEAAIQGVEVYQARCSHRAGQRPCESWLQMVGQLVDRMKIVDGLQEAVRDAMTPHRLIVQAAMPGLANVLSWRANQSGDSDAIKPAQIAEVFHHLWETVAGISNGLMLSIDDIQWIDDHSLEILEGLIANPIPG
ncbi:MAG: AAA family ATPase, partial [Planctomycetota bacterium]